MSKRAWVFVAAAIGLALSQVAWAAPPQQNNQHQQTIASDQSPQKGAPLQEEAKRPNYNLNTCYQNPNHEDADLCAQWRAAVAAEKAAKMAYWSNWISGGGALLSFLSVVFVLVALCLARQANRISREIGEKQVRAYLGVQGVIYWRDAAGKNVVTMDISNTGQSPARQILVWTSMTYSGEEEKHRLPVRSKGDGRDILPDLGLGAKVSHDSVMESIYATYAGIVTIDIEIGYKTVFSEKYIWLCAQGKVSASSVVGPCNPVALKIQVTKSGTEDS